MKINFYIIIVLFCAIITFSTSCSTKYKAVNSFHKNTNKTTLIIYLTDFLDAYNQTIEIDSTINYTDDQIDSISWYSSNYVQFLDNQKFLDIYKENLVNKLEKYGFNVVFEFENSNTINAINNYYKIDINEFIFQESYYYQTNYDEQYDYYSTNEVKINRIDFLTNIEITDLFSKKTSNLKLESFTEEEIESTEWFFGNEIQISTPIHRKITMRNIYNISKQLSELHSEFIYQKIFNDYIENYFPEMNN